GVTGYPQSLLVMERFGYPDYYLASAQELVGASTKTGLISGPSWTRSLTLLPDSARSSCKRVRVMSRWSPRVAHFARVQATTKNRVDLCLRLEGQKLTGRLRSSRLHEHMGFEITLATADDVDSEVLGWLQRAFDQNCFSKL